MTAILNVLSKSAIAITDHSGTIAAKWINVSGIASIGAGLITGAVNGTAEKIIEQSQPLSIPDYLAIVGIVSGVMLIIKNSVELVFKIIDWREARREKKAAKKKGGKDVQA